MSDAIEVELCLPKESLEKYRDDVWDILQQIDAEFVPSLSARRSTTTKALDTPSAWIGPVDYFDSVMQQPTFIARVDGKVAGICSFIPHYTDELLAPCNPSTYVSTMAIKMMFRRKGAGRALNQAVEDMRGDLASSYITTRTWSTNTSNISLLGERGYREIIRLPNNRGPNIDTIYFALDLNNRSET